MSNIERNLKHGQDANRSPKHEVHQPDGSTTQETIRVTNSSEEK